MKNQYEIDYQQGYDAANDKWVEVIEQIKAEIKQNSYPIVHGANNHEQGMTVYGIMQVIDRHVKEYTE